MIETSTLFPPQVVRTAFREAAAFWVATVARVPADAWDGRHLPSKAVDDALLDPLCQGRQDR